MRVRQFWHSMAPYAPLVALVLVLLLLPTAASAYIDPGTGSYIFQVLVATLVTAGFFVRGVWARVVAAFRRRGGRLESSDTNRQP